MPYVGLSLLWVVSLGLKGFSPGTWFSPLLKNQHLEIPVRSGIRWTKNDSVDVLTVNRYPDIFLFIHHLIPPG